MANTCPTRMYVVVCTGWWRWYRDMTSNTCLTLMYICLFTGLVKKYNQVMQRYYVQYLSNYDAVCLNSIIQVRYCLYTEVKIWKTKEWSVIGFNAHYQGKKDDRNFLFSVGMTVPALFFVEDCSLQNRFQQLFLLLTSCIFFLSKYTCLDIPK